MGDEDYKRAGFQLLPTANGKLGPEIGLLSFAFCVLMQLNVMLGWWFGFFGVLALVALSLLNAYFAWRCWQLYKACSRDAARRQMFASFLHLPLSLIVLLIDKF
jgi:protoheme IX farnesyltransferase